MLEVKDFLPFIHSKILDLFKKEEKKKKTCGNNLKTNICLKIQMYGIGRKK